MTDIIELDRPVVEAVLAVLIATYPEFGQYTGDTVPLCVNALNAALDIQPLFEKVAGEWQIANPTPEPPKSGPDKIRDAIRLDRGGEAPTRVQGFA